MKSHPDHYEHKFMIRSTPTYQSTNITNNVHHLQLYNSNQIASRNYKSQLQTNPFQYRQMQYKLKHLDQIIKKDLNCLKDSKLDYSIKKKDSLNRNESQQYQHRSVLSDSAQRNLMSRNLNDITSAKLCQSEIFLKQQKRFNIISNQPQQDKQKKFRPFPKFPIQCPNTKYLCK